MKLTQLLTLISYYDFSSQKKWANKCEILPRYLNMRTHQNICIQWSQKSLWTCSRTFLRTSCIASRLKTLHSLQVQIQKLSLQTGGLFFHHWQTPKDCGLAGQLSWLRSTWLAAAAGVMRRCDVHSSRRPPVNHSKWHTLARISWLPSQALDTRTACGAWLLPSPVSLHHSPFFDFFFLIQQDEGALE